MNEQEQIGWIIEAMPLPQNQDSIAVAAWKNEMDEIQHATVTGIGSAGERVLLAREGSGQWHVRRILTDPILKGTQLLGSIYSEVSKDSGVMVIAELPGGALKNVFAFCEDELVRTAKDKMVLTEVTSTRPLMLKVIGLVDDKCKAA